MSYYRSCPRRTRDKSSPGWRSPRGRVYRIHFLGSVAAPPMTFLIQKLPDNEFFHRGWQGVQVSKNHFLAYFVQKTNISRPEHPAPTPRLSLNGWPVKRAGLAPPIRRICIRLPKVLNYVVLGTPRFSFSYSNLLKKIPCSTKPPTEPVFCDHMTIAFPDRSATRAGASASPKASVSCFCIPQLLPLW
jgi:hypothetical protein